MSRIHIDFETYSEIKLGGPKNVGVHAYSEHLSTTILCCAFTEDDDEPQLWLPASISQKYRTAIWQAMGMIRVHYECPDHLFDGLLLGDIDDYAAHNAEFERVIGNSHAGRAFGFPQTRASDWICTAAKAAAHGLPRALGNACDALETKHRKDETGRGIMLQLARPRRQADGFNQATRWTLENAFDKHIDMYKYCLDDVRAERCLDETIPELSPNERTIYLLDQKINDRGIRIDVPAVQDALFLISEYKLLLDKRCVEMTGIHLTQTALLADWIREYGFPGLPNLQAETIRETLAGKHGSNIPERIRQILRLRAAHAMKATSKLEKMLLSKSGDDRLRSMFLYHGAATGRWAGQLVQLQNIFRGLIKDPDTVIALYAHRSLELIQAILAYPPMVAFSSTVRGMLIASEGRRFVVSDFSSIEARVIAWYAGQEDVLDVFRSHGMIYEHTAAKMFYPDKVDDIDFLKRMKDENPDARFQGKTATLALGFEGGYRALKRMAYKFGLEMTDDAAKATVESWRSENKKIKILWQNLRDYSIEAVNNPGKNYKTNRVIFRKSGDYLYTRLPSGRRLAYHQPLVQEGVFGEELTYMGIDTFTRQWTRVNTYGGRISENITQALARDLLCNGLVNLDNAGYTIVGHVHDEAICDEPVGEHSAEECSELLCRLPSWAEGLPLDAVGWEGDRYRKE